MILTSRKLSEAEVLHGPGGNKRLLWVEENVCQSVESDMVVSDVDTHCLFAHSRLVRVTW